MRIVDLGRGRSTRVDRRGRPMLTKTIAARMVRVDDVDSGSVIKLLNNLMFGAINAVTAEALVLC